MLSCSQPEALMRKRLLGYICLVCSVLTCWAQSEAPAQKPLAELSYRPVGKLIYVPVQVNGSDPLTFISTRAHQTA